ncbi:MAG: efflux RND transporter periplasmic adaptor subunit [Gammaproteobacteria bacterium]|nr:efflux RND transporter periplasmic adaptor subunit [Gammaproteobacteria bacterium]MCP4090673.1 efflux RND transporter periplasmic adaptor subunit [Gammaproteobacteria bacterium]MCP4276975.1 efflux RND transporter periplasmic adaptor subunit [Gammaproteobacteria bacterium]MCP4832662.1 efflux RND transporter periplasmic adaptor subunit [Gammaproteobacteria bacterium]MCP4930228.1 efflux RND transporter periplasmic adaptor subunit [Gammaproteobacteria bacterium]
MNIKATIARKPWILALLVLIIVAIWMASGLTSAPVITTDTSQISAPGDVSAITKVQVTTLHAEPISRFISVYGRTAPARSITISAETEGRVKAIKAPRGKRVAKGDVILELDMRDRQARINQTKASVHEHRTSYEAQISLQSDGYVSDTEIAETLAKLEAAKAELVRAELDLANRIIRAPFDGVLQERDVEIGDFVRSGDAIATFVDNITLIVTGTLAEQELAHISAGDEARAELVTGENVKGIVRYLAPVADESTRTFKIELEINNSSGKLPAGVTAEIILTGNEALAQKISPALLQLDSKGALGIYVVDSLQQAQFIPVNIERSETNGIWVSGLPKTAEVITVGQGYVNDGQLVEPSHTSIETAVAAETL